MLLRLEPALNSVRLNMREMECQALNRYQDIPASPLGPCLPHIYPQTRRITRNPHSPQPIFYPRVPKVLGYRDQFYAIVI